MRYRVEALRIEWHRGIHRDKDTKTRRCYARVGMYGFSDFLRSEYTRRDDRSRVMFPAIWVRDLWNRSTHDNLDVEENIRHKEEEVSNRDIRLVGFQVW